MVMYGILPYCILEYGEKGITIPTVDGVSFKNATLHVGDVSNEWCSVCLVTPKIIYICAELCCDQHRFCI